MSDTLQFRTVFYDPGVPMPERPVQAFHSHPAAAKDWAKGQLSKAVAENAEVWVYECEEKLIGTYIKKGISSGTADKDEIASVKNSKQETIQLKEKKEEKTSAN